MKLLLVAARLLPVTLLLPARVPLLARAVLGVLLAALLVPVLADAALPAGPLAAAALALRELAVGAVLALLVAVPFWAAQAAGGIAGAAVGAGGRVADFALLLAAAVFFASGSHLLAVRALAASYQAVPLAAASPAPAGALATTVIDATAHLVLAAVGLAAPVLAALFFADVALALAGRAARGLPVAEVAGPLRAAAAIFALLASLAGIALAIRGELGAALVHLAHPFG